ncbi:MAG: hypothetical protein ACI8RZ_004821 [Myxococcota bacterium]|jgi:hypothetical protein
MMVMMGTASADEISVEAILQVTPSGELASGLGARLDSGSAFLALEGRGEADGIWVGRATGGLDLFGNSERIDMTLGLFLGTTGSTSYPSIDTVGTAGFEFGLGGNFGNLRARYRHANGFSGPLENHLTEDEFRLGYRAFDTVEVFGQYVRFNPGEHAVIDGYGVGVKVVF